jgi:hypothetical protein
LIGGFFSSTQTVLFEKLSASNPKLASVVAPPRAADVKPEKISSCVINFARSAPSVFSVPVVVTAEVPEVTMVIASV